MLNFKYKLHKITGYVSDIIIAEYENKILILDGGCLPDALKIKKYILNQLKLNMSQVKLSFISHMHPDHTGGALRLRKVFGIPIASSKDINLWYKNISGSIQHKIDTLMAYWVAIKVKRNRFSNIFCKKKINLDFDVKEGETLPFFNDWKILQTPGHTSHDISLYNKRDFSLFTGDIILCVKGKMLLPFPVSFPDMMERTLEKLNQYKVKKLILSHGGIIVVDDFNKIINDLKEKLKKGRGVYWDLLKIFQMFSPEIRKYIV